MDRFQFGYNKVLGTFPVVYVAGMTGYFNQIYDYRLYLLENGFFFVHKKENKFPKIFIPHSCISKFELVGNESLASLREGHDASLKCNIKITYEYNHVHSVVVFRIYYVRDCKKLEAIMRNNNIFAQFRQPPQQSAT
ncbi:MAG: hypothetical protein FWE86_04760 [Oscillospiraceae bacterium]|nr:hypothetical protein [Oscillospiraceae bacterium]